MDAPWITDYDPDTIADCFKTFDVKVLQSIYDGYSETVEKGWMPLAIPQDPLEGLKLYHFCVLEPKC